MAEQEIVYQDIRKRVERRFKVDFFIHLMAYLGINLGLWIIYRVWDANDQPWPLIITILWGTVIFAHGAAVLLGSGLLEGLKDEQVEREIERERMRLGSYESKRKNDENSKGKNDDNSRMRLSDDGELIPVDEKEDVQSTARANR